MKKKKKWGVFPGKRALVVGLGQSGLAACRLLVKKGVHVLVSDERNKKTLRPFLKKLPSSVQIEIGSHTKFLNRYDFLVVSPGVGNKNRYLKEAHKKKIPIWSELELGWRFVNPKKTVAITGTNGKTTTTALLVHLLKKSNLSVAVGGNIGTPLSHLVGTVTPKTILVLEISSYQLEYHQTFHPNISILLNITPDHLGRHGSMKNYAHAKGRMFIRQGKSDIIIYNKNDQWCRHLVSNRPSKKIPFPQAELVHLATHTTLLGAHNIENAMAAVAAAKSLGLKSDKIIETIKSFRGVKHRLQRVGQRQGVLYVNDSKATNVDSTLVALRSFKKPIVLLMGGEDKGNSYKPLVKDIQKRCRIVIAYGEARQIIRKGLSKNRMIKLTETLRQAVSLASKSAKKGDVVLLSPACASFDQYKNYEQRGDHFISLVKRVPA